MDAPTRADWRDHLRDAADLALVGIAVTLCALPVVTLGSALATASAAIRHRRVEGGYPALRTLARDFARGIPSGAVAVAVFLAVEGLLVVNLRVAASGALPGGRVVVVVTAAVVFAVAGFALLTVSVHSGRWRDAIRAGARIASTPWWVAPVATAAMMVAATIGVLVPATVVLLPGFVVYAGQAVLVRAARTKPSDGHGIGFPTSVPEPRSPAATVHGGWSDGSA